jgi:hypothetical protein
MMRRMGGYREIDACNRNGGFIVPDQLRKYSKHDT